MNVRLIAPIERDQFFRFTFALGNGNSLSRHLAFCKRNPKLQAARHFVLEDAPGDWCSSVSVHTFRCRSVPDSPPVTSIAGLADLYTPASLRHRGYATRLLSDLLTDLEMQGETVAYLLADIDSVFYERLGFRPLPVRYELAPDCTPMLRCPPEHWDELNADRQLLLGLMAFVD